MPISARRRPLYDCLVMMQMGELDPQSFNCSYQGALLAGVDEVGRGPLVGNVVAAAVILDPENSVPGLRDSKKLSEKKREALFEEINAKAIAVGIGAASVEEIDQINILHASMLAMQRATEALSPAPEYVLVDGNRLPDWGFASQAVVKGDSLVDCISAASIIAKVTRDREMVALAARYPEYGFARHKGYPTALHLEMLEEHGPTEHHRKSFGPVRRILKT